MNTSFLKRVMKFWIGPEAPSASRRPGARMEVSDPEAECVNHESILHAREPGTCPE